MSVSVELNCWLKFQYVTVINWWKVLLLGKWWCRVARCRWCCQEFVRGEEEWSECHASAGAMIMRFKLHENVYFLEISKQFRSLFLLRKWIKREWHNDAKIYVFILQMGETFSWTLERCDGMWFERVHSLLTRTRSHIDQAAMLHLILNYFRLMRTFNNPNCLH